MVWGFFIYCREALCQMTGFSAKHRDVFYVLILCLLVFWGCNTNKTERPISAIDQKDSINIWIDWARDSTALSQIAKKEFLNKALTSAKSSLPDTLKTKSLSQISLTYKKFGDTTAFKSVNAELIQLSEKIEDYQCLGEAHWDLGYFHRRSMPDSAYYHYNKAYGYFLNAELSDAAKDYPGRLLYAMATVKNRSKDYVGAEKDIVQAIDFYKSNGHTNRLFDAYNLLANIENGLNNLEKALEYHTKASEYIQFRNPKKQFQDSLYTINNRGAAFIRNGDYDSGVTLFEQILKRDGLRRKLPTTYAKALASLANGKLKKGDEDFENMEQLLTESNKILDGLGNSYDKARNHEFMALLLSKQKDTPSAITSAVKAKNIAAETNNNDRLLSSLKLLTTLDEENSQGYANAYFNLSDSLQVQERSIRDKFARIQMETDEVIEENEALTRKIQIRTLMAGLFLLFGLAVFIIINQGNKNQKLKFEQKQQESNQEIYNLMLSQQGKFQEGKQLEQKRISEELHDGILGEMLGIRLILSGLNDRSDEAAVAQRGELIEKFRELEEEIRGISHELNDASYQKIHNFILAIDDLVESIGASAQLQSHFTHDEKVDWDALDGKTKINIYRIVQECLQNSVKHANCNEVRVDFKSNTKNLELCISDNGQGFDKKKGKKGIGMKNIISRTDKMSGSVKVDSEIGKGTKITIFVPLEKYVEKLETELLQEV